MLAMCYGGGTNSAAIILELIKRGIRPDVITFADTGAERKSTYDHIRLMSDWCEINGFPPITTVTQVKRDGSLNYLYELCIEKKMLPSLAYGFKTCSQKHKVAPQDKFMNNHPMAKAVWKKGEKVKKIIGYDRGESHRVKNYEDDKYEFWYPLVEWGWFREDCVKAIDEAKLQRPGKSACFFCPSTRKPEIKQLAREEPELIAKAIFMEENAELTQVKGLGRRFNWGEFLATKNSNDSSCGVDISCDCFE